MSPETNPLPGPLTTCLLAQAFLFYRKWESNLCAAFCLGACIIFSLITIARLIAAKHVFIARPNLEPISLRFPSLVVSLPLYPSPPLSRSVFNVFLLLILSFKSLSLSLFFYVFLLSLSPFLRLSALCSPSIVMDSNPL